jgi:O-antigen ligase
VSTVVARTGLRQATFERGALAFAGAIGVLIGSALLAVALARFQPPLLIALGGCLGLGLVLALAVARYDAAVALGLLLIGVVQVEPAPPDAVFGIVIAVALVTGRFHLDGAPLSMIALVGGLLAINSLSIIDAADPVRAVFFFAITAYLAIFAIWFAGYLDSERRARMTVRMYLAAAVAAALLGSASLFFAFPGSELMNNSGLRAKALFEDPNVYAPFLIPIMLILIDELMSPKLLRSGRLMKLALLFVLALGLFFSYSRGAYLNFLLGVVVMLGITALRRGGGRRAMTLLVVMVVGGIAVFGAASATGSLEFLQQRAQEQSYDVERFAAQRRGIEYGQTYPLGIGPGQFEVIAPHPTHNLYIRVFSEQGLIGLLVILALVLGTLVLALRNALLGRDTYGIASAALLGAWLGMVAESAVIDTLHWRHLWLVAALIWAGSCVKPAQRAGPERI